MITRRALGLACVFLLSLGSNAFAHPKDDDRHPAAPVTSVGVKTVASGLTSPIGVVSANDRTGRLFIIDQIGMVRVIMPNGTLSTQPFLDLTSKVVKLTPGYDERGLLGLAFHPKFAQNGRFFVFYNIPLRAGAPAGFDSTLRLSEFKISSDPNAADPASERVILEVDKPQFNHNGGTIAFGHDRLLYISIGDGGGANDGEGPGSVPLGHTPGTGNAQDLTKLLGKFLRIDIDRGVPYSIPPGNPFVGTNARPEIYAYGFRNPFRFSFDMGEDKRLLSGDAGQNLWEEIDLVKKGGNYGWRLKEGTHFFDPNNPNASPPTGATTGADGEPLIDPVIEYPNAANKMPGVVGLGIANIGGNVYRGRAIRGLSGLYIFGDFSKSFFNSSTPSAPGDGTLFVATPLDEEDEGDKDDRDDDGDHDGRDNNRHNNPQPRLWPFHELSIHGSPDGRLHHYIKGFGQDDQGEVYIMVTDVLGPAGKTGQVLKIVP